MKKENTSATIGTLAPTLIMMGTSDAIGFDLSTNNVSLRTNKLKVQVAIELGKDQSPVFSFDDLVTVVASKSFDDGGITREFRLSLAHLMTLASNGLFELFNTNPKTKEQFVDLVVALENKFNYPSSYTQSLKKDPFSWATFIGELNTDRDSGALTAEQLEQYVQVQSKAPKIKELSAFLVKAYDSPKWQWLAERMDAAGYTVGVVSDDLENLL